MAARSQVDQYQIIRKLGAGTFAKVKLALDTCTGVLVALKVMKGDEASIPQRYLAQRKSEIEALSRLNHPSIVRILNVNLNAVYMSKSGRQFPVAYIAMELMVNGELFDVISYTGRMEAPIARVYFRQLLDAVGTCHENGITHRDLKPENILFDEQFNLKIADFGFAGPTQGRDGSGLLRTQLGTEAYVVPEILLHQPYSGVSADLFACGVILFILINQTPPFFSAKQSDRYYSYFLTQNDFFWTLHSRNKPQGLFTPEFKELINAMLAFTPAQRPTLQQILESPWLNGPTSLGGGEDPSQPHDSDPPSPPSPGGPSRRAQREMAERHARALHAKSQESKRKVVVSTNARQYRGDLGDSADTPMVDLGASSYGSAFSTGQKTLNLSDSADYSALETSASGLSLSFPGQSALPPLIEGTNKYTRLYTSLRPDKIMYLLAAFLKEKEAEVYESDKKFRLHAKLLTDSDSVELEAKLWDAGEGCVCVELLKNDGPTYDFVKVFEELKREFDVVEAE